MVEEVLSASPVYRIFHIAADGHIKRSEVLEARDDEHALVLARSLVNGCPAELWERARRIARLEPDRLERFLLP